ncbi:hypothetical protein MMC19_007141 [Ptychographa xylographoides]|nr:hypothetical protein [Ptychographa xylographoides]
MRFTLLALAALSSSGALVSASPVSFGSPIVLPGLNLVPKSALTPSLTKCDLQSATQPAATTPLPPPSASLSVYHIAIGRGTQNYTCADSTAASIPASIGAVASLYNASCVAVGYPTVFATLPQEALRVPITSIPPQLVPSGKHYFSDATTPTFDLGPLGFVHLKKVASVPAPAANPPAVAWLKLEYETQGDIGPIQEVYRLNTAGGSPPANCSGMPATFQVQYAAEYWFYAT